MEITLIPDLPRLITHAVGFLITFWVLKKFAWQPLLSLMEERRNKIAAEFQNIDDEKAKAAELVAEYEAKLKDIDSERREKLLEAVNEGKKIADDIKLAAQEEAKKAAVKAKDELDRDVVKAKVQLKDDMVSITIAAAEKILKEKLDDAKHRELIGRFIDNVEKA
ncbi:MAG TPA: F0F1 ATP synthase subunit B [candidate division Zixibacteria bacterium]|nr:F0F1 ATP synthase subunit B [candidate division Zixibacteria bacterium]